MERFAPSRTISRKISQNLNLLISASSLLLVLCVAGSGRAKAQETSSGLLQKATVAFSPSGKMPHSVTLNGTVEWTAGSLKESGTVTLQISSDGSFVETWSLPSQSHTYQSTSPSGARICTYTDASGKQQSINDASCLQAIPWFAPWIALNPASNSSFSATDTTQPSDTSAGHEKLSFTTNLGTPAAATNTVTPSPGILQQGTLVNIYYDHQSAQPASLRCDRILDNDATHLIQNEVVFADYRPEGGYTLPHRISRYVQRTLQADITITSVTTE